MATNRKKSTMTKVGTAVKKAARTVAAKADKYVMKPVGKALGMKGKKSSATASATKKTGAAKTTKAGSTKKAAAKPAKKATAGSAKKGTAKSAGRGR
jgi:hypothetical protein